MNHLLLPVFIFSLLCSKGSLVNAQNTFAPIGAEWWYQGNSYKYTSWPGGLTIPNITWTDHVQVIGDTLIDGTSSRKVTVKRKYKSGAYGDSIMEESTRTLFLYDNTDTVFVYNSSRSEFVPLYIFNVAANDTIRLREPLNPGNTDSLYLVIDSVVSENFGGHLLKSYYTNSYKFDTIGGNSSALNYGSIRGINDLKSTGKYTERLGMTLPHLSGFFPYRTYGVQDITLDPDYPSGNLTCYKDNIYDIKLGDANCDFIPTPVLGIKSLKQKTGFTLSPNPARGITILNGNELLPKGTFMRLYDLSGKEMLPPVDIAGKLKVPIDVTQLPPGMYILQIEGITFYSHHKIIVQN